MRYVFICATIMLTLQSENPLRLIFLCNRKSLFSISGSQTTQLIGRRVRELNTYCEIVPYNKFPHDDPSVIGVILSGSPFSVYDGKAFRMSLDGIRGRLPILGICYGAQFMAYTNGGTVEPAGTREYGRAHLEKI